MLINDGRPSRAGGILHRGTLIGEEVYAGRRTSAAAPVANLAVRDILR
jgi:hypothetical protein